MPPRGEVFELTLIERLEDEPRGWCVDAAGHQVRAIMVGGVHGHTCYSYEGRGEYRVAEDQGFLLADIESNNRFRLAHFDHCLTKSGPGPGTWLALTPCDNREEQGFRMTVDGLVQSLQESDLCVTLGSETVPGGGGEPVHQIRELRMQTCSEEAAPLQRWRLRDYKDW